MGNKMVTKKMRNLFYVFWFEKCHDLRLNEDQECENEGGDAATRGLDVNRFSECIHNGDDLLNQQKVILVVGDLDKGAKNRATFNCLEFDARKRPKNKLTSNINFKFRSKFRRFHMWKCRKRKKIGGAKCELKYNKWNFNIWKWEEEKRKDICRRLYGSHRKYDVGSWECLGECVIY
ncbi:hypothetical protein Tco_1272292 [Tanacetum coccineum]